MCLPLTSATWVARAATCFRLTWATWFAGAQAPTCIRLTWATWVARAATCLRLTWATWVAGAQAPTCIRLTWATWGRSGGHVPPAHVGHMGRGCSSAHVHPAHVGRMEPLKRPRASGSRGPHGLLLSPPGPCSRASRAASPSAVRAVVSRGAPAAEPSVVIDAVSGACSTGRVRWVA